MFKKRKINNNFPLNSKIFSDDVPLVPVRFGFGDGLLIAGEKDENVVALSADLTESTRTHLFADKFPKRFIQVGIAEQNMASVASGMAAMGKIPFMTSYAMFSPGRNWEQIRTTIAYNDTNVKIVGSHAGVTVGPDGGTHQALEDIALTRVIPRMTVICPCDHIEARKATIAIAKMKGPVYLRLTREKTPVITTEESPFKIGKAEIVYGNPKSSMKFWREKTEKVGIIASGWLLHTAIKVAKNLENSGIKATVLNLSTIKPLDEMSIVSLAKDTGAIVTVEEHQIAGGVGSAISECLVKHFPVPIEFVGVSDKFGQSGTAKELIEYYGMGEKDIVSAIEKVLRRKKFKS